MCSSVQNADKLNKKLDVNLDPAIFLTTDVLAPKKNSTPLAKKLVAHYDQAPLIDVKICSRTDNANAITKELVVKNKNLLALGSKKCSLTDNAKGLRQSLNVYANALVILDHPKLCSQIVKGVTLIQKVTANSNKTVILNKFLCSLVERGMLPRKGKSVWIDRPIPVEPPDAPDSFLIIPTRTTYIMNHTVSIKIEDGTDIHFSSFSINHSIDSYSFSFSANLIDKGQVNLLLSTEPVRLFINVDGVDFVVIVTDITESLAFNSRGISVEAVSLSALLDAPYANISSNTYASNATVQQLFDLHLTTGWTETWVGNPWIVEGGAYSYSEKTPIQAMAEISNSIGYVIIPSFDSQSLSVQPRYKILAHKFYDENTVTDVFIPESVVISSSKQNQVDSKINGVYVHGGEIGGQIGFCRIDGTAGDVLAPTISNNLMTDPGSLPHRQLRNHNPRAKGSVESSLPHRQLRKVLTRH
ncbi:MAG: hypothetical protein KAG26_08055 [Methylococcales bacterium]|nr:hypothetical protein [Methylococcales bacterium]